MRAVWWLLVAALLAACGGGDGTGNLRPQQWENAVVQVEVRPRTPRVGMNEFLVVVSDERRRPVHDLIVSLRVAGQEKWRQAIQDGRTGVYRRAVRVDDPENDVLEVHLRRRNGEETVLRFPIVDAFQPLSSG